MTIQSRLFGYWLCVDTKESALYAVRMAGLPVLVMGANAALLAILLLKQGAAGPGPAAWSAGLALVLIVLSFRLRAGHAAWIPLVPVLFCAFLAANAVSNYGVWVGAEQSRLTGALIIVGLIVPLFCSALVIGAVRGWLWLKAIKAKPSF